MDSKAKNIVDDFETLNSWEDKYEYLISLGEGVPPPPLEIKIDSNLIAGCQSKVWLFCEKKNKKLYFYGDSDALITRGLISLAVLLYSGSTAKEIIDFKGNVFLDIGLDNHLSMTRLNGLANMIKKIGDYAKLNL